MSAVEAFGAVAVSAMVLCYALEHRGRGYVFGFAGACLASSGYALLIRSWPFAAVEFVWAAVALHRACVPTRAPGSAPTRTPGSRE